MRRPSKPLTAIAGASFILTLIACNGFNYINLPSPSAQTQFAQTTGARWSTAAEATAFKPGMSYSFPASSTNVVHLSTKAIPDLTIQGDGTPPSVVKRVASMLQKYQFVQQDAATLRLGTTHPVLIRLAQTASDYANELSSLGMARTDAQNLSQDTGGFTQGNTILVSLPQNTREQDLANTLAHELTHVLINANFSQIPSWLNEGVAVYDGMRAQDEVQGNLLYGAYARQMAESVLDAARSDQLEPLAVDESQVLDGEHTYDLELQDWLAVSYLMNRYGPKPFWNYFSLRRLGESHTTAFNRSFVITFHQLNDEITRLLTDASRSRDEGVKVTLAVSKQYKGMVKVLARGTRTWRGMAAHSGTMTFFVNPSGTVDGVGKSTATADKNPADPDTLYINLSPKTPLWYHGHRVTDCGFAVDDHYGLYQFVNSWVTTADGNSTYLNTASLFGVTLQGLVEPDATNPLIPLLTPNRFY